MQSESILAFRRVSALFFVSLLLLASIYSSAPAQELAKMYVVGEAELLKDQFVSQTIKDPNGEVCAVVTIVTDLKGDIAFEAGAGIVKGVYEPGESSLFLSPGERIITVRMSGFEPLRIILKEHGIPRLESGRVWQLKVSGKIIPPDTGKGDFTLATDPPGAEIRIEDFPDFKGVTPFDFKSYSARPYRVHLSKNRYAPVDTFLVIEKDRKSSLTIALQPLHGLLSVTSNEQNTTFIVTDLETNKVVYNARGNPNREVLTGRYRIDAEAPEYMVISQEVVIQEGATQSVSITFTENQRRAYVEARQRKMKTLTKSLLIPGTGQWYADYKSKGVIITVLQLATAGGAVNATLNVMNAMDNYDTARKAYAEAGANYKSFFDEKYQEVKKTHDDAVSASNLQKAALGAVAVVYFYNIIDAALTTRKIDQKPKSVSLRIEQVIEPGRFGFIAAVRF